MFLISVAASARSRGTENAMFFLIVLPPSGPFTSAPTEIAQQPRPFNMCSDEMTYMRWPRHGRVPNVDTRGAFHPSPRCKHDLSIILELHRLEPFAFRECSQGHEMFGSVKVKLLPRTMSRPMTPATAQTRPGHLMIPLRLIPRCY